jgi:hypothetical protein
MLISRPILAQHCARISKQGAPGLFLAHPSGYRNLSGATIMKHNQRSILSVPAALIAVIAMAGNSVQGVAGEDTQAERESRRIEGEARRQQELARRDIEARERAQADALRGQEEALRRMEATRSRIESSTEQIARQSVDQERNARYTYSTPAVPLPGPDPASAAVHVPSGSLRPDLFSDMVLAPLSERLGRYFGAQSGVLVVRAGAHAPLGLQDGDVIHSIDGRVPVDEQHAAGILRSYRAGERVKLRIQRDRLAIDLNATVPEAR